MVENTIPQAAAETVSAMLESDAGFKAALEQDPMAALASIGLGGMLAAELANGLAAQEQADVSGYVAGVAPTCAWLTKKGCACTQYKKVKTKLVCDLSKC